jgi:hypothetical protein
MVRRALDGALVERAFDWRSRHDPRSRNYTVRAHLRRRGETGLRGRTWACYAELDQGREGACVGFGWAAELAATPCVVRGVTNTLGFSIYREAQALDGFPDTEEGSSVLAGAKAVQRRGHLREYRWAFSIEDVCETLSHLGPVVLGIPWLDTMMDARRNGLLDCSGQEVGGHCILARGLLLKPKPRDYGTTDPLIRLRQSWGDGDRFVRVADLEQLLKDAGEACVPIVRA